MRSSSAGLHFCIPAVLMSAEPAMGHRDMDACYLWGRTLRRLPAWAVGKLRSHSPGECVRLAWKGKPTLGTDFDEIYNERFARRNAARTKSAEIIADSIVQTLRPRSVVDVGCGGGALLGALTSRGIRARGLEYSTAALRRCRNAGLDVMCFDLRRDDPPDALRADVVVSLEVGEHLPEDAADRYVDILCRIGDVVVFSAATPGQGGLDHINERPHRYWARGFADRGFALRKSTSGAWRASWRTGGAAPWYHQNVMVFRKAERTLPRKTSAAGTRAPIRSP